MSEDAPHVDALRTWAEGLRGRVAAVDLLITSGFAARSWSWVNVSESGRAWIDFVALHESAEQFSGGEQGLLRVAASIGGNLPVRLQHTFASLDDVSVGLVLKALATASQSRPSRD